MMGKNVNLLDGPVFSGLTKLAVPIMATSMVQMAYNMIDKIWIGRLGSGAVTVPLSINYLQILGISQLLMCMEFLLVTWFAFFLRKYEKRLTQ